MSRGSNLIRVSRLRKMKITEGVLSCTMRYLWRISLQSRILRATFIGEARNPAFSPVSVKDLLQQTYYNNRLLSLEKNIHMCGLVYIQIATDERVFNLVFQVDVPCVQQLSATRSPPPSTHSWEMLMLVTCPARNMGLNYTQYRGCSL